MPIKILVLEDDLHINDLIKFHLAAEGFEIVQAFDAQGALALFDLSFDLAILDIMVPLGDGFNVLKVLRSQSDLPIIFLTARDEETHKVLALGLGADDYITKPFSMLELLSRVKAHLRRYHHYTSKTHQICDTLSNGNITLHLSTFTVEKNGTPMILNAKEFKLLCYFMQNIGQVFTKKQLYEKVWEEPYYGDDNTIMVHISRLRDKLEDCPKAPTYIKTIKGLGYRMEAL